MGEDGARGKDWLRARGHNLCLTDTIFNLFIIFLFFFFFFFGGGGGGGGGRGLEEESTVKLWTFI